MKTGTESWPRPQQEIRPRNKNLEKGTGLDRRAAARKPARQKKSIESNRRERAPREKGSNLDQGKNHCVSLASDSAAQSNDIGQNEPQIQQNSKGWEKQIAHSKCKNQNFH
jgi:hypothetical protein